MILKVYCDANVFIDYYEERQDYIRPLKDFAFNFFSKGWNCHFNLIVSSWLVKELRNNLKENQIQEIFNEFKKKNKLIYIKEEPGDREKAKSISKNWDDPLHAVLANKAGADYLTTRNLPHFRGCEDLVRIVFPEFI